MNLTSDVLIVAAALLLGACGTQKSTVQFDPKADACTILPAEAVSSIEGERVLQVEPSQTANGGLSSRRCFYRTENFSRSVDLEMIAAAENEDALNEFWSKRFHSAQPDDEEEEREEAEQHLPPAEQREREEERAKAKPSPVPGLGDEAFWVSNQLNSTLYVRQTGSVIRISLGGVDDQGVKLDRARAIVEKITGQKQ